MSQTLTAILPHTLTAVDVVSRELVGFIPSVFRDPSTARAALNETVKSHVAPAATATDITAGVTPPNDGNQTIGAVDLSITKARRVPIKWTGEQIKAANNGGPGQRRLLVDQFAQAMRTLTNEMEADLAALHITASRAFGTAGNTPFGTAGDYTDASFARKILIDNGAPNSDLRLVVSTAAGANMRGKQGGKVNEAGTDSMLRQGVLLDIHGFAIRESAAVVDFTKGTNAAGTTNAAGYAIGATTITLAAAGAGNILAGDVITFAGDTNKYVVTTGDTDVSNAGTIVLAAPGLRQAIGAGAVVITTVANSSRSMAFRESAIVLATRLPALPDEGDLAIDRTTIIDPNSGIAMELSVYPMYRQIQYELSVVWGVKNVKPEHTAILLG